MGFPVRWNIEESEDRTQGQREGLRSQTRQQKRSLPRSQEDAPIYSPHPAIPPGSSGASCKGTPIRREQEQAAICLAGDQTKEPEKPKEQLGSSLPVPVKLPNRIFKCMQSGGLEFGVWRMSVCPSPSVCGQPETQRNEMQ